jgi:hypothetical protein
MFNFNKTNRNALMSITVLMVIISVLTTMGSRSMYQPRPIKVKTVSEKSLFNLEHKLECVPGAPKGSPYTKGLTPGGLCGAQELVRAHDAYSIESGIGGSLI